MRSEELVRRADEHVDAELLHVDLPVRPVVNGVHPGEGSGIVRQRGDLGDRRDRAHGVRRVRERDHACAIREQRSQMVDVETALVVDLRELDDQAPVARQLEPGRDVAVVIEPRADDLVARDPLSPGGSRECEVEGRHVRAEGDLLGGRVEELGGRLSRALDERVGTP